MTNDELKIIVAEQSNNIISELNIKLLNHDDLIRLICLMINVKHSTFHFKQLKRIFPLKNLLNT